MRVSICVRIHFFFNMNRMPLDGIPVLTNNFPLFYAVSCALVSDLPAIWISDSRGRHGVRVLSQRAGCSRGRGGWEACGCEGDAHLWGCF